MSLNHKLLLEVNDQGRRVFKDEGEPVKCQDALSRNVAWGVAQALGIMRSPPAHADIVLAMARGSPKDLIEVLARFYGWWDGCNDFDAAFTLTVDLGVLMPECTEKELVEVKAFAKSAGVAVK